jgi:chromosome segregation ATPase
MTTILSEQDAAKRLETASRKAQQINDKLIGYEATMQQLRRQLSDYEKEAEELFNTSNLDEMRKIYKEKVEKQTQEIISFENTVKETELLISQIESEVEKVEQKYAR